MKKVEKIKQLLKRVLYNTTNPTDYGISIILINKREFEKLQELIKSIIIKEERKPKPDRLINFDMLIEAKTLIDEYVEQLTYEPETNGQFDD